MSKQICFKCKQPFKAGVSFPAEGADGNLYHRNCFKCDSCAAPLWYGDGAYYEVGDKKLCPKCQDTDLGQNSWETCAHCNKPIKKAYMECEGLKLHEECLVCYRCKGSLKDTGCFEVGKKLYHLQCAP